MIQRGAKATKENYRDNYQTPRYILDKVDEFFKTNWQGEWFDPFPVNPIFDIFEMVRPETKWPMYINPPFSRYGEAVEHLVNCKWGFEQIWILSNIKTETQFAQILLDQSTAVCYLNKRVPFIDPRTGEPAKNNYCGQILIYLGKNTKDFAAVFKDLGVCKIHE